MNKPNLVNIDRFKKKVRNLKTKTVTMPTQDMKDLDADLDELMMYTVMLQAEIIALQQIGRGIRNHITDDPTLGDYDADDFF